MLLPQTRLLGIVVLCLCWVTFGANAQQNLEAGSISGTLLMLDDRHFGGPRVANFLLIHNKQSPLRRTHQ
jgi:hypothetical protein